MLGACCIGAYRAAARLPVRAVLLSSLLVHACFLFALPLFSTDLFSYLAYGEIAARGMNPLAVGPAALGDSPVVALANWRDSPSVYGPVANLLMQVAGRVGLWAHSPVWVAGACYKAIVGALDLASILAVYAIAKPLGTPALAGGFVLFSLNPLIGWEVVAQGHNDGLVVFAAAGYLWAMARKKELLGFASLVLGTLSKFVLAPVAALHLWSALRHDWKVAVRLVALTSVLAVAAYAPMWSGSASLAAWLRPFRNDAFLLNGNSIFELTWRVLHAVRLPASAKAPVFLFFVWTGRLVVVVVGLVALLRLRTPEDVGPIALVVLVAILSSSTVLVPWYLTWIVPFAALQLERRWQVLTLGLSVVAAPALGVKGMWVLLPLCQIAGLIAVFRWTLNGAAPQAPVPARDAS